MSFGVTLLHVLPASFVTVMTPSSEPVQTTFVVRLDGAMEKITA